VLFRRVGCLRWWDTAACFLYVIIQDARTGSWNRENSDAKGKAWRAVTHPGKIHPVEEVSITALRVHIVRLRVNTFTRVVHMVR
jgi:hypothetical protein